MLLVSAILVSTSTYAWFTMNTTVSATNMVVQAKAEGGLLITEVDNKGSVWDDVANTTTEGSEAKVALYPTSTANSKTWYHATSKTANDAAAASSGTASSLKASGYTELSLTSNIIQAAANGANGKKEVFYTDTDGTSGYSAGDAKYYLKYTYYLKSSSESDLTLGVAKNNQNVNISVVNVTFPTTKNSENLNKALRVGIALAGKFYIFAPVGGATGTYYVNAASAATTVRDSSSSKTADMTVCTGLTSLPAISAANGTEVNIFLWFEGEDAACKSDNIAATLDELTVDVTFKLVKLSEAGSDTGVAIPTT